MEVPFLRIGVWKLRLYREKARAAAEWSTAEETLINLLKLTYLWRLQEKPGSRFRVGFGLRSPFIIRFVFKLYFSGL